MVTTNDLAGRTPLLGAAVGGSKKAAQRLLENEANVNARGCSDRSALHYAADGGHVDVVRLLLDSGADANAKDEGGHTPLDLLERASKNGTIKHKKKNEALLRKHGGKTSAELKQQDAK